MLLNLSIAMVDDSDDDLDMTQYVLCTPHRSLFLALYLPACPPARSPAAPF